jgi:hypothetical protein
MQRVTWICAFSFVALALSACGSSGGGTGGDGGTSSSYDGTTASSSSSYVGTSTTATTTGTGGSTTSGTGGGATCSGSTPVALTVKNYLAWCSVSVDGGTASAAAEQTVCVADGSATLDATALPGFVLGDWHGTSGDTGSGDPGTVSGGQSTAMVTVSGSSACVWVCCPFTNGTGCTTTNQCP